MGTAYGWSRAELLDLTFDELSWWAVAALEGKDLVRGRC